MEAVADLQPDPARTGKISHTDSACHGALIVHACMAPLTCAAARDRLRFAARFYTRPPTRPRQNEESISLPESDKGVLCQAVDCAPTPLRMAEIVWVSG